MSTTNYIGCTSSRDILSGTPLYPKAHIILTLVFFIVWCLVGYLLPENEWDRSKNGVWGGYKGKSNYCEEIRHAAAKNNPKNKMTFKNSTSNSTSNTTTTSAFMAQPVNSLSNYTFVAYGFIVLSLFWSDALEASRVASSSTSTTSTTTTTATTTIPVRRNTLQSHPTWSLVLSLAMMLIGTTSFLFHASLTPVTQILDVAAIYQGLGLLLLYNFARFFQPIPLHEAVRRFLLERFSSKCCVPNSPEVPCCKRRTQHLVNYFLMVIGVFICCPLLYLYKKKLQSRVMFPMLVIGNVLVHIVHCLLYRPTIKYSYFGITGMTLLIAILFRESEVNGWGVECNPTSAWQGHAAWHFFTATSLFFAYLMFRSETYYNMESTSPSRMQEMEIVEIPTDADVQRDEKE